MRNDNNSRINKIFSAAKKLPCFSLDDLATMETHKTYLKNYQNSQNKNTQWIVREGSKKL